MALDVWLVLPVRGGANSCRRHVTALWSSGELEFLRSYWPKRTTRGVIDEYDDALFRGSTLMVLRAAIERATANLVARPDEWSEVVGEQFHPMREHLYSLVTKVAIAHHLAELAKAVEEAMQRRGAIEFIGD